MTETIKYNIDELIKLKTDVLEQRRNILKNDSKALSDNQKEYLKLYSKIRYYTDEEYRKLKNIRDNQYYHDNLKELKEYRRQYYRMRKK